MSRLLLIVVAVAHIGPAPARGQFFQFTREQMIHYTPQNPYPRFEDGRPKVPDELLERVKGVSVEKALEVMRAKGYEFQFAGGFKVLHPGKKLVGRAFTAQYLPLRPDLEKILAADAEARGETSRTNNKVIDMLGPRDVPVVDLMRAKPGNNFGGDNLHAAIYGATGTGAVVDGTVRDLEGLAELPTQVYFREGHPAAVGGVSVAGINIPIKIGDAIVMPGDVVLGDRNGVLFIPPHLVEEVLDKAGR